MAAKSVRYCGPHDVVELSVLGGKIVQVRRGEIVDLPAEVVDSLVEQDVWEPAEKSVKAAKEA